MTLPNPKSHKDKTQSSQQQQTFQESTWPSSVLNTSKGTLMVNLKSYTRNKLIDMANTA